MYVSISFFKRYAHHPDLPSSPTRRSSDLSSKGGTLERPHQLEHGVALAPMPILPDLCGCENDTRRNRDSIDQIDRKSTRLNSSHTVISYAVFCLKKKKKKTKNDKIIITNK